jgi:hypothetical protein
MISIRIPITMCGMKLYISEVRSLGWISGGVFAFVVFGVINLFKVWI